MKKILIICQLMIIISLFSNEVSVKKVSLFKNGFGYFNTELLLGDSPMVKVSDLPVQTHGTFWITHTKEVILKNVYSSINEVDKKRDFNDFADLLKINTGKEIKITRGYKDVPTITGIIQSVSDSVVLLKTKKGAEAVKIINIAGLNFTDMNINTEVTYTEDATELNMELSKPMAGKSIGLQFMTRGITWVPSYIIDITHPEKAVLTAKALIINEVIDLEDVDVDFITGFPFIEFSHTDSPMAKKQKLYDFFNSLSPGSSSYIESDLMVQSVMSNRAAFIQPVPEYNPPKDIEATEDLFFYPVKNITLKKGDTAYVPLFTFETTYKDIYTLSLTNYLDDYGRPIDQKQRNVFHSIKLKNNKRTPLTTAPAQFISGGSFVGQSISNYTPAGGEAIIKINNAVNISAEDNEVETKRVRDADKFNNYSYDLVTLTGEIHIKNSQNRTIDMEIEKTATGEIIDVSSDGSVSYSGSGLKKINPNSKIVWNIKLSPWETKVLTYSYKVYIRD